MDSRPSAAMVRATTGSKFEPRGVTGGRRCGSYPKPSLSLAGMGRWIDLLMRIVAWNCNMALHRKWDAFLSLNADIAVLCESAQPSVLRAKGCHLDGLSMVWAGRMASNPNKGLLVLARNGFEIELAPNWEPRCEIFLPIQVKGREVFRMLAVWSFNTRSAGSRLPRSEAMSLYGDWLGEGLLLGDFNSHVRWDRARSKHSFRRYVEDLRATSIYSLYHRRLGIEQGEERDATLYWRSRKPDRDTYHVDYFFAHERWAERCQAFTVGTYEDWILTKQSDHVPLIADFAPARSVPEAA